MKTLAKLVAAAAFTFTATAAFAQSTALDNPQYWQDNSDMINPGVAELMWDSDAQVLRSDDDFAAMWVEATPDVQDAFRMACSEWEKDKALFTDTVSARCKLAVPE